MFMGPIEADKARDDNSVRGIHKFLQRIEKLYQENNIYQSPEFKKLSPGKQKNALQHIDSLLHKTIKTMTDDMYKLKYNTAISKLMILINKIYEVGSAQKNHIETIALLLAPFATELASKLRKKTGNNDDIHYHSRPTYDETLILNEKIELAVQINGKMR